ncbi:MAG: class I mannose-6-phosphate isomerase [Clostridia bacterium]|nr:class I mannose-6-phosphate isomerase [Clostridia bacterium]
MKDINSILRSPIFFESNRVRRIYRGGALFAGFFGDRSEDGFYPEEWIASSVLALNDNSDGIEVTHEGISVVRGCDILFSELVENYPRELFGERNDAGILVKMLDSAIRLPVQSHPDKAFARQHFHSSYGKTESWVILGTREDACIYYGFKDHVTKERFRAAVRESATNRDAMVPLLNRVPVKAGDVFLIAPKTVHAIGPGCLILETQEPTDFTIQPEAWCGDHILSEKEMYLGLDEEAALGCFDYDTFGAETVNMARQTPQVELSREGIQLEWLISYDSTPCFAVKQLTLEGASYTSLPRASVCVIVEGEGEVSGMHGSERVKKGDFFFVPHAAADSITLTGSMTAIFCLPPKG